jgi:hypothetical protein
VLELVEEALDEVALFVEIGVVGGNASTGPIEGNDSLSLGLCNGVSEVIGVVGLVGEDVQGGQTIDQRLSLGDVIALPGGEDEAYRVAESINGGVQLGGQAAA